MSKSKRCRYCRKLRPTYLLASHEKKCQFEEMLFQERKKKMKLDGRKPESFMERLQREKWDGPL